tara:strand:- start:15 stop:125 length:111 start_codon:yes stop_codon:yes gene_type:complete
MTIDDQAVLTALAIFFFGIAIACLIIALPALYRVSS